MSALGHVEPALADLRNDIGLLRHVGCSPEQVTGSQLARLADHMELAHQTLADEWDRAWKERGEWLTSLEALKTAHAAELAKVKAEKAAPGSVDDVESADACWWLLAGAAKVALQRCAEAGRDTRGNRVPKPAGKPKKAAGRRKRG